MVRLLMSALVAGVVLASAGCCGCHDKSSSKDPSARAGGESAGGSLADGSSDRGAANGQRSRAATRPVERGTVLRGRVVNEPPAPGRVGIERWRFVPDGEAGTFLRLTRTKMQEARPPEAGEIRLDPWAGNEIRVRYQTKDGTWVWGAEVVE